MYFFYFFVHRVKMVNQDLVVKTENVVLLAPRVSQTLPSARDREKTLIPY